MHYSKALLLSLASSAIAAPVAEPAPQPEASLVERQLIAGLSQPTSQLLTLLGLGALAQPVTGILGTVGTAVDGVTGSLAGNGQPVTAPLKRDLSDIEKRQLIQGLSTPVSQLLTLLGLGALAQPVTGVINTVGTTVDGITGSLAGSGTPVTAPLKRDLASMSELEKRQFLSGLSPSIAQLLSLFGLGALGEPITGILGTVDTSLQDLTGALGGNGSPITTPVKRDFTAMTELEKRQLLAGLSPSIAQLLGLFGLGGLADPVTGILGTVDTSLQGITDALAGGGAPVTAPL